MARRPPRLTPVERARAKLALEEQWAAELKADVDRVYQAAQLATPESRPFNRNSYASELVWRVAAWAKAERAAERIRDRLLMARVYSGGAERDEAIAQLASSIGLPLAPREAL
jgi:hypothetical protein